jgi:hypothetical protein
MTEKEFKTGKKDKSGNVALKDFHIFCPPHHDIQIKKGESLDKIPEIYHPNLITEGVMKG